MASRLRIYVDEREKSSNVPQLLLRKGLVIIFRKLDVGDYLLPGDYCVERKTARDFVSSLFDGRLFDQARRLSETYRNAVIIIEGDLSQVERVTTRREAVIGALVSLTIDFDIKLLFSWDKEGTAELISYLARRISREKPRSQFVIHKKPPLGSVREWQLYIVQSLPNIGPKLAVRLLERFGSPLQVFNASIADLSRVEGLGEKRAEQIVEILRSPYGRRDKHGTLSIEAFISKENTEDRK